ncbi:MAG TPA: hypothetical protein VIC85_17375 [Ktedonobacterales bacterium]|jgi:hypothetical protein
MRVAQQGRAIVRRLPGRADGRTFRPGDFLLTRREGALAGLLGLATGGELNHAAVIVDPSGGLIEATPCATIGGHPLRRAHIADYLDAGRPCWVGYVEVRDGTRQLVVEYVERLFATQRRLSELGIAALAMQMLLGIAPRARTERHPWLRPLHPLFDRHALVIREEHTYLAGELVARALERGGFVWDGDPAYVTPASLFASYCPRDDVGPGVLVPLDSARLARRGRQAMVTSGGGQVSAFPARTLAAVGQGAVLRAEAPRAAEVTNPDGLRALAQVALVAFGSLTVAHGLEILIRSLHQES